MRFLAFIFDLLLPRRPTAVLVDEINENEFLMFACPTEVALRRSYNSALHVTTLLPYSQKYVQACVLEAKFHKNIRAISHLGAALREYLLNFLAEEGAFGVGRFVVIPLPLSESRMKERGNNQVESVVRNAVQGELLEKFYINSSLLVRNRNTTPQTSLSGAERRKNIRGAFGAPQVLSPHHTYILVDDVTTTGSTLAEAIETLRTAGAIHLFAIALADAS